MLADDHAVEQVVFDEGGILDSLAPGAIHVSMSTISVALAERLAAAHRDKGQEFVAAPVFGRPDAAAAAKLFIVTAGKPEAVATCQPLFDALGQSTFVVSQEAPKANLVKLSGNFLIASVIDALGEAIALVSKAGIDRAQYVDLLTATLFGAPVYKTYGALIAEERYHPAGFRAELGYKDVQLALNAAKDLLVPMPMASLISDRFLASDCRRWRRRSTGRRSASSPSVTPARRRHWSRPSETHGFARRDYAGHARAGQKLSALPASGGVP